MAVSGSPRPESSTPDGSGADVPARDTTGPSADETGGETRGESGLGETDASRRAREAARRRRLAIALGEALPEGTSDERAEGWGERPDGSDDDRLRREVPPHHG